MIIVLNGPLGIGKSTLAEALCESIQQCVMLDGDHLIATNPRRFDQYQHLHSTIALLVPHHRRFGYRHFIIDHIWTSPAQLADLRERLVSVDDNMKCFLLTLSIEENLRRIERRASVRMLDEHEFERRTFKEEREILGEHPGGDLGDPFDVSGPPPQLVGKILQRVGLR